jgi:hypothetical protein
MHALLIARSTSSRYSISVHVRANMSGVTLLMLCVWSTWGVHDRCRCLIHLVHHVTPKGQCQVIVEAIGRTVQSNILERFGWEIPVQLNSSAVRHCLVRLKAAVPTLGVPKTFRDFSCADAIFVCDWPQRHHIAHCPSRGVDRNFIYLKAQISKPRNFIFSDFVDIRFCNRRDNLGTFCICICIQSNLARTPHFVHHQYLRQNGLALN